MIDPVIRALEKFLTYPSALIIKENISQQNKFSFTEILQYEIEKELTNFKNSKKLKII